MGLNLSVPLAGIKGIPPRFLKNLEKLKIFTVKDLLWHFPSRYEDFSEVVKIANLEPGQHVTVQGVVKNIKIRRTFRRRFVVVDAAISDDTGDIKAVWFNQPYLLNTLRPGRMANFSGKISLGENEIYLSNPAYELLSTRTHTDETRTSTENSSDESVSGRYESVPVHTGRLVPVYPETRGLTSRGIRFLVKPILKSIGEVKEWIPEDALEAAELPEVNDALRAAHFPRSIEEATAARKRFSFEELFLLQLMNMRLKLKLASEKAPPIKTSVERLKKITESLPFKLTLSQKKSLWEIVQDIGKPKPMNRLLQGDVGSGKTVVAAIAALLAAENGYQSAFMAPTEILARQHFRTLKKIFAGLPLEKQPEIGLLVSKEAKIFYENDLENSVSKAEFKKKITAGTVMVVVGTHALIEKDVRFENLGLVIVDEQHRFGVRQRKALVARTGTDLTQTDTESKDGLLYEKLTYAIRGVAFKVRKELGLGHKESIYQKAFEKELKKSGLAFDKEKSIDVKYNDEKIGVYRPDFIVENKIVLELKSLPSIGKFEKQQIWHYLKTTDYRLALLINFGRDDVEIKRIIHGYEAADDDSQRKSVSSPRKSVLLLHLLSMSATPIPRTLMLTVFGDLDISIIDELPSGRKPIVTKIVAPENRSKAYAFIRGQVRKKRQVFVICPRIDKPPTDADDTRTNAEKSQRWSAFSQRESAALTDVKAVKEEYEKLSKNVFPDLRVGMLHGQIKSKEKAAIMKKFQNGEIDILVSTSVVEVGVDVPNATIMMIEGADRFGLAQLYQFRGRVGRGEHQSFCFLFTDSTAKTTSERLKAILEAKNGFELAEKDLKLRGPGEFLGHKQTGLPDVAMRGLQDFELIKSSRETATRVLEKDKNLKNHPLLAEKLAEFEKRIHLE